MKREGCYGRQSDVHLIKKQKEIGTYCISVDCRDAAESCVVWHSSLTRESFGVCRLLAERTHLLP